MTGTELDLDIPEGFTNAWTDAFRSDAMIHLLLMFSIVSGAFQGWLKDRMPGALPYALSDGAFILAAMLWFASAVVLRRPLLRAPRGTSMDLILLAVILTPALYLLEPDTPFLVKAAGLRAWSAFPVACLMGMTLIRTPGQVRAYIGVILLTCLVTGIYGIMQYIKGPEAALATQLGLSRHGDTVYYGFGDETGGSAFRAFSTFTFPGPFAMMMEFGIVLAAGVVFSPARPATQRLLSALLIPVLFAGLMVSGTRAALVTLLVGLLVLGWLRGLSFAQLLVIPGLLGGLYFATILAPGHLLTRFASIQQEGVAWGYVKDPVIVALRALADQPFGYGLGRTGVGVPFAITSRMPQGYFIFSDGDIGRAAVELGILGVLVVGFIVIGLLPKMLRAALRLTRGSESDLALGIGALVLSGGLIILIGSPLSTTPHAVIWWLLFGALVRLAMLSDERVAREGDLDTASASPPAAR